MVGPIRPLMPQARHSDGTGRTSNSAITPHAVTDPRSSAIPLLAVDQRIREMSRAVGRVAITTRAPAASQSKHPATGYTRVVPTAIRSRLDPPPCAIDHSARGLAKKMGARDTAACEHGGLPHHGTRSRPAASTTQPQRCRTACTVPAPHQAIGGMPGPWCRPRCSANSCSCRGFSV